MSTFFEAIRKQFRLADKQLDEATYRSLQESILAWLGMRSQEKEALGEAVNGVIYQAFHWYLPADSQHWKRLTDETPQLAKAGFTALWLPPACKAAGGTNDVGYGIYDFYDLGEFHQKGTVPTKYGTRDDFVALMNAGTRAGLHLYADAVFNHKLGGDKEEEFEAVPVAEDDRNRDMGPPEKIKSYTCFEFAGRGGRYSTMQYHWQHFNAVDYNSFKRNEKQIYRIKDKSFATKVEQEKGNFDYLMGCDVDVDHPEVKADLQHWGEWMLDFGIDGFRLDAIKHIDGDFFHAWIDVLEKKLGRDIFAVGEYWSADVNTLNWYIANTEGRLSLFDVGLHYQFAEAGTRGREFDMRTIFQGSLVQRVPVLAVTFVDNHDTQPLTSLQSPVADWFKPLAYALILLRRDGYPCVFYGDYAGAEYEAHGAKVTLPSHRFLIDKFLAARQDHAYGQQHDYFDHGNVVGWTRLGSEVHPGGLAVLMSNGEQGTKWMDIGHPLARYVDVTGHVPDPVHTNDKGWGEFRCQGGKVSVWVPQQES